MNSQKKIQTKTERVKTNPLSSSMKNKRRSHQLPTLDDETNIHAKSLPQNYISAEIEGLRVQAPPSHSMTQEPESTTSVSPPTQTQQNPTEIVRSIASYLSLSDVDSIGSLFSLAVSPHVYGYAGSTSTGGHFGSPRSGMNTNLRSRTGSYSYRMNRSCSSTSASAGKASAGYTGSSSDRVEEAQDNNMSCGTTTTRLQGQADMTAKHSSSSANTCDSSGPDAAAGFGAPTGTAHGPLSWTAMEKYNSEADGVPQDVTSSYTPGLVALSPVPLDEEEDEVDYCASDEGDGRIKTPLSPSLLEEEERDDLLLRQKPFKMKHLKNIQEKLKVAVFSHPGSMRSYCLSSYHTAAKLRRRREYEKMLYENKRRRTLSNDESQSIIPVESDSDELEGLSLSCSYRRLEDDVPSLPMRILQLIASPVLENIPLSILFDVAQQLFGVALDMTIATFHLSKLSLDGYIYVLGSVIEEIWRFLRTKLNPLNLIDAILKLEQNAKGASEVIVTGIQSVATGVGSAISRNDAGHTNDGITTGLKSTGTSSSTKSSMANGLGKISMLRGAVSVRENVMNEKVRYCYLDLTSLFALCLFQAHFCGSDISKTE